MKGLESIVGAYFAIMIIIGVMIAFHTWATSSIRDLSIQVNKALDNIQHVVYSPVISIKEVDKNSITIEVNALIPVNITEIVMKTPNNKVVFHAIINTFTTSHLELELPRPNETVLLYIVIDDGLIFYYIPRLDPRLQTAPDSIKNKVYIDAELLNYLSSPKSTNIGQDMMWTVIDHIDYKVSWGITWESRYQEALMRLPVNCRYVSKNSYCNVDMDVASSALTHKVPIGNTYYSSNGYLRVYDFNYTQVYKVIRYRGWGSISFIMNMSLRGINIYAGTFIRPLPVIFIPVIYVFDVNCNLLHHVTVYQFVPIQYFVLPQVAGNIWIDRILLENTTLYWNSLEYWNKSYYVVVNTAKYPLAEGYILVGVEAVLPVNSAAYYSLEVKIDIQPYS